MSAGTLKYLILAFLLFIHHLAVAQEETSLIDIAKDSKNPIENRIEAYHSLATTYAKENLNKALLYVQDAKVLIPKDSLRLIANNSRINASIFLQTIQLDSARLYFKKAIKADSIIGNKEGMAQAYNGLSVLAVKNSNYPEGILNSHKTLELMEEIDNKNVITFIEYNLAMLHLHVKNYQKATYHHKKALNNSIAVKDSVMTRTIYGGLANVYLRTNRKDSASFFVNKILEYSAGDINRDMGYYFFSGSILYKEKKYREALIALRKAATIASSNDEQIYIKKIIASIYLDTERPQFALKEVTLMDSLIGNNKVASLQQIRDSLYGATYLALNNTEKFNFYNIRYQKSRDSVFSLENIHKLNNLENTIIEKKQRKLFKSQQGRLDSYSFRNKTLVIILALSVLLLGFFIIRLFMRKHSLQEEKNFFEKQFNDVSTTNTNLKNKLLAVSKNVATQTTISKKKKYIHSSLSAEQRQEMMKKIVDYMDEIKPHLDCDLSQKKLAESLYISSHHLSEVLNLNLGKNFYSFINLYRIEEAKKILLNDKENLTMFAVAFDSGFNSKASFNRVFKDITGITPTAFKNE